MKLLYYLIIASFCIQQCSFAAGEDEEFVFEDEPKNIEVSFTPVTPPQVEQVGLTVQLPILGSVTLYPAKPPRKGLEAQIPQQVKTLQVGPLTIKTGIISFGEKMLAYTAPATFFNKNATVSLEKVEEVQSTAQSTTINAAQLSIAFTDKPTLELLPGKKATIEAADLIIRANKSPIIRIKTSFADQIIIAQLTIVGQQQIIEFELPLVALIKLIPELQNTMLQYIEFKNVKVQGTLGKTTKDYRFKFSGNADISKLHIQKIGTLDLAAFSAELTPESFEAAIQVKDVVIPLIGTIPTAKLEIKKIGKNKTQARIEHRGTYLVPRLGSLDITIDIDIAEEVKFSGKLNQSITYSGLTIHNADLTIDSKKRQAIISGNATLFDTTIKVNLDITQEGEISVDGEFISKAPLRPFKNSKIPDLASLAFSNPRLILERKGEELTIGIGGIIQLFDKTFNAVLYGSGALTGLSGYIEIALPQGSKLSDIIPQAKNSELDTIVFDDMMLIISSDAFTDTARKLQIKEGINFFARARQQGILENIAKLTKTSKNQDIMFTGILAKPLAESKIEATIPVTVVVKKDKFALSNVGIKLTFSPPLFAVESTMRVKPTRKDDWLIVQAIIGAGPSDADISGSLAGSWKNPFGIQRLVLRDTAVEVGINYQVLLATGLPSTLGITSKFDIGKTTVDMAGKVSFAKSDDMALIGSLSELDFKELIALAYKMTKLNNARKTFPAVSLKNLKVYIVPKDTTIGTYTFPQGVSLEGTLQIPPFVGTGQVSMTQTGIIGHGYATKTQVGPLKITGSQLGGPATLLAGPEIKIELTALKQDVFVSANVELGDLFKGDTLIQLDIDKMSFELVAKIKNMFDAKIKAQVGLLINQDVYLRIEFLSDFMEYLKKIITQELSDFQRKASSQLKEDQDNLDSLKRKVEKYDDEIQSKKEQIQKLQNTPADLGTKIKLGLEIGALEVQREPVYGAYKAAYGILEGLKHTAYYTIGESGKLITRSLLDIIQIQEVFFEGSASQIVHGVMPRLTLVVKIFGKEHTLNDVQFDFNHPEASARAIAQALKKFLE